MTRASSLPRRSPGANHLAASARPRRTRLQLECLEDRAVPSYFPVTTNGIHVLEDQLPGGLSSAMVRFLATHTDGTQKQTLNITNQFRAINPNFTVLHYQLGTGNSAYQYIINNQWSSDFSFVNQHEDWFAHQTYSGEPQSAADLASGRVGNSTGWYQADISNLAWQQYTLGQVLQNIAATGSNAWFADSYIFGIGGAGYSAPIPTRYQGTNAANPAYWPGGVTWTTQLGNWARAVENAFAQYNAAHGTSYKFLPNLDGRTTSWEPNWYNDASGVPFIDGAFLEHFGQATNTYDWKLSMNRGLNLTHNGKIVIMEPYLGGPDTAAGQRQRTFLLGTYLLLKGDHTYLNMISGGGAQYFPEYQLNLGAPVAPPPAGVSSYLWNGVYRRNFQNGFVLVNPGSTTYTLSLGGSYRQVQGHGGGTLTASQIDAKGNYTGGYLTYQTVSSVTLPGGYAAIFLNLAAPAPGSAGLTNQGAGQSVSVAQSFDMPVSPSSQAGGLWAAATTSARALTDPAGGLATATRLAGSGMGVNPNATESHSGQAGPSFFGWDVASHGNLHAALSLSGAVPDSHGVSPEGSGRSEAWVSLDDAAFRFSDLAGPDTSLGDLVNGMPHG